MSHAPIRDVSAKDIANMAADVIQAIDNKSPLPGASATWLRQGMSAILSGKDARLALHLKTAHGKRAEHGVQKALRDEHIRTLAACIDPENRDPTATSKRVAEIINGSLNAPDGMKDIVESIRQAGAVGARQTLRIQSAEKPACDVSATINPLLCLWINSQ
jgi:hypothetical protein